MSSGKKPYVPVGDHLIIILDGDDDGLKWEHHAEGLISARERGHQLVEEIEDATQCKVLHCVYDSQFLPWSPKCPSKKK